MRIAWTLVRVLLMLVAIGTLFLTVLFVSSPSGTTVDAGGALIDLAALAVLVASASSLRRERRPAP